MKRRMASRTASLAPMVVLLGVASGIGRAQQANLEQSQPRSNVPRVENARVQTRSVTGTLSASITDAEKSVAGSAWLGYTVKAVAGERTFCCGNYNEAGEARCGKCELEARRDHWNGTHSKNTTTTTVALEAGQQLIVLFRLQDKQISRIKLASEDCTLDAGGLPLLWFTNVKSAESVTFLAEFVRKDHAGEHDRNSTGNEALTAIALHDGQAAQAVLESFTALTQPEELRKQAAFWLGEARGKEGLIVLQGMARNDPSTEVRAHIAFALSVSKDPVALDEMIRMAHQDESAHVRGQAIFWLAQKAGKRAVNAIDAAIENDPNSDVKKQAVFALSQLPKDEGVPKLIQVAENNRNPAVRKQAMFWLGQSQDARALEFIEKVLTR